MKNIKIAQENDQVEQIRNWLKENSIQIIIGISLSFASIWGWNAYNKYLQNKSVEARNNYLSLVSQPDNMEVFNNIKTNHTDSSYTEYASLIMAKNHVEKQQYQQALKLIKPLFTSKNILISHSARLRAANIYLEIDNYEQALKALEIDTTSEFNGLYNNIKGDIYLVKNDIEAAKKHYRLALNKVGESSGLKNLIQIKLNDIN